MSSEGWFQDPKDEADIVKMGKLIEGMTDTFEMKMKIAGAFCHRRATWMADEAIKRERIRAELFAKEPTRARA